MMDLVQSHDVYTDEGKKKKGNDYTLNTLTHLQKSIPLEFSLIQFARQNALCQKDGNL